MAEDVAVTKAESQSANKNRKIQKIHLEMSYVDKADVLHASRKATCPKIVRKRQKRIKI